MGGDQIGHFWKFLRGFRRRAMGGKVECRVRLPGGLLKKIFRDRRETGQGSQEEPCWSAEIGNRQKTSESLQSSNRDIRQVHRVSGKIGGTIPVETAARIGRAD
jgi:hypothetical protein